MSLHIEVQGLDALKRKLDKVTDPLRPLTEKVVKYAHGQAQEGARPAHATGKLASSIKQELAPAGMPLSAKVFTRNPLGTTIEEGRKPGGKMAPISPVRTWAARRGLAERAFYLARSFGRRGTKGLFFMKGAAEATRKKLPELLREAGHEIEKAWGR